MVFIHLNFRLITFSFLVKAACYPRNASLTPFIMTANMFFLKQIEPKKCQMINQLKANITHVVRIMSIL